MTYRDRLAGEASEPPARPEPGALDKVLAFTEDEYRERLGRLQDEIRGLGLDGMLSVAPENLTYLSGYQNPGYFAWQGMIIPSQGIPTIVTRYLETPNVQAWSWFESVVGIADAEDPMVVMVHTLKDIGLGRARLGIELDSWFITNRQFRQLEQLTDGTSWSDVGGIIEQLRIIKSPAEVAYIREACRQAEAMMRAGWDAVSNGARTEADVAAAVLAELARSNGELAGLPPFVVSGPRTGIPHATWSDREFERGDPIMLELAGCKFRYSGALLRTAFVGEMSNEHRRVADVCIAGLEAGLENIRPGVEARKADAAMMDVFREAGFGEGATHRAGYAIGLNWPPGWGEGHIIDISAGERQVFRAGMTFHVPGPLLFLGTHAVGLSETVLVTETGVELLTDFPRVFPVL